MSEVEDFLAAVLPRVTAADTAIHNGDAGPRVALWSHNDPVTLFGAALAGSGWAEIRPIFERLAASLSNGTYCNEVIAAGASGDLGYTVAFEHSTASVNGVPHEPYVLRVTTVFRREDGQWKVVHRHGDTLASPSAAKLAERLAAR
jgi:ketosteroid isomerase-like protein